jgi:adenosine deaminase
LQSDVQIEQVNTLGIPIEVCPTSNLSFAPSASGLVSRLPHLQQLVLLDHNIIICCDDTMLYSTNLSTEMFEFANAFQVTPA